MSNMPSISRYKDIKNTVQHNTYYVETKEDGTVIQDKSRLLPVIRFRGTVKLHGTFAGVIYDPATKTVTPVSKGSKLSIQKDNAGFAQFVKNREEEIIKYMSDIPAEEGTIFELTGEFAGKGIQKNVAINNIEKSWFLFGIRYKMPNQDWKWADAPRTILGIIADGIDNVYSIYRFKTYEVMINFNDDEEALKTIEKITNEIDAQCPVGKALGFDGAGEGVVFVGFGPNHERYSFKSKGESHSKSSKIKQPKEKDPREQEKLEFAEKVTPVWRLEQASQEVNNLNNGGYCSIKTTGDVIKWVLSDIIKEEQQEFKESNFELKDVQKFITKIVAVWYKKECE